MMTQGALRLRPGRVIARFPIASIDTSSPVSKAADFVALADEMAALVAAKGEDAAVELDGASQAVSDGKARLKLSEDRGAHAILVTLGPVT